MCFYFSFLFFALINSLIYNSLSKPQKMTIIGSYQSYLGTPRVKVHFNGQKVVQWLEIDQMKDFTWTSSYMYFTQSQNKGTFIKDAEIDDFSKSFKSLPSAKEYKNNLDIFGIKDAVNDIHFYVIDITGQIVRPPFFLGLSFKYKNEEFDIIRKMYSQGIISKPAYGFIPSEDGEDGLMFIGEAPSYVTQGRYQLKCKINEMHMEWSCSMTDVIINNLTYHTKSDAFFNVNKKITYAPKKVLSALKNALDYIDRELNCHIVSPFSETFIRCEKEIEKVNDKIGFVFNEQVLYLNISSLFLCKVGLFCDSQIASKENSGENTWIFGSHILEKFITVFDYEEKEVNFYLNESIKKFDEENTIEKGHYYKRLYIFSIVLLLSFGSIINLYFFKFKGR